MQITKLEIENFLSHEHTELSLANLGLVLIEGENGVGKSTLFEAPHWGFFGTTPRGLRGDEVIRLDSHKKPVNNTRVAISLDVDGHDIRIERHRQHHKFNNKLLVFANGKEITCGAGDRETQAKINELLQIDEDSFVSAVMFPQGAAGFASLSDSEQKSVLDKILGTGRFAVAQERLKGKVKRVESAILESKSTRIAKQSQISQLESNVNDLEEKHVLFCNQKGFNIEQAQTKIGTVEATSIPNDTTLDAKIGDIRSTITARNLNAKYAQLQVAQAKYQEIDKQLATEKARLDTIQKQLASAGPEPQKPRPIDELTAISGEITDLTAKVAMALRDKRGCDEDLAIAIGANQLRDKATNCNHCGQTLTQEGRDRLFGKANETIESLKQKSKELEEFLAHKQPLLAANRKTHEEQQRVLLAHRTWQNKTESASQITQLASAVNILTMSQATARGDYDREAREYKAGYDEVTALNGTLAQLSQQKQAQEVALANWKRQIDQLRADLERIKNEQSPYEPLHRKAVADLKSAKNSVGMSETIEKALTQDVKYLEFWVEGFGHAGVKSLLLDTVTPFLSYRASEYLELLTNSSAKIEFCTQKTLASGEKRDKFEVQVSYDHGADTYKGVSGGEKRRVDLAALFALGDLAASRSLAPIRLRLLDEPFDNLDSQGAEAVVQILREKIVDRCGTCLVITHDDNLKGLIDKRIVVVKENGISRILP